MQFTFGEIHGKIAEYGEGTAMTIIVTGGAGFIGSNFLFHMRKSHPD
ncbi:MAG: hypothetical protein MR636_00210 [Clostridiales bacterium]|nr:hypothetical protein [Clostridiales bacterium]